MENNRYSLVTDSSYRLFLKDDGYGFLATLHTGGGRLVVTPMNKGVDMDGAVLTNIAKRLLNGANRRV